MSLIHRVGASLIVVGGLLPAHVNAQWPQPGCGCNGPAPMAQMPQMAPMFGSELMAPQTCGGPQFGPRMRAPRPQRPWVYRSHTRTRISGPSMFGDATMGLPMGDCGCSQPAMMLPQSAPMMIPQQSLIPQQIVTYRDVPKTVMRQEAIQVQVPSTTYKQVTMDEGGYQQVWVPRMVTKNVPQTVMQAQVQYRQVPQTVMERVPQVSTQWIPQQTVQQVAAPTTCGQNYAFGGSAYPIATPTTVTPVPEYNSPAPLNSAPSSNSATLPTPVPQTSQVQEWQKVRQRPSSTIEQQAYEYETQDEGYRVPKAAGRFSSKR